jgi:hypothetical protein
MHPSVFVINNKTKKKKKAYRIAEPKIRNSQANPQEPYGLGGIATVGTGSLSVVGAE